MDKEVLIFLHMDDEHPGYIADYFLQRNIPRRIVRCYKGEPVPKLDDSIAGLVFMGGVMSVNDELPWIASEVNLIEAALHKGVPLLGHCLGGQLISKALGENVTENPVKEVGWHDCHRSDSSATDDWLGEVEDPFVMFHWHSETFSVPADAQLLFSSSHCKNQAYSYGDRVLAMQCHVEMTLPLITRWITNWREDLELETESEQNFEQINQQLATKITALNRVADSLYGRWLASFSP
ncbi:MAG: type 1 glutamine amidotransferase [Pseudohongiellaceae bacterium]